MQPTSQHTRHLTRTGAKFDVLVDPVDARFCIIQVRIPSLSFTPNHSARGEQAYVNFIRLCCDVSCSVTGQYVWPRWLGRFANNIVRAAFKAFFEVVRENSVKDVYQAGKGLN